MRNATLGELVVGEKPVLVATSIADSVQGMIDGATQVLEAGADCVELRIDRLSSDAEVAEVIDRVAMPHIVACRTPEFGGFFEGSERERIERLEAAACAGATAVDIEFFTEPDLRLRLVDTARREGVPVLIGYENMRQTPPKSDLLEGLRDVARLGPNLIKLAVRATSYVDLLTVLDTVLEARLLLDVPFAAIALGPYGAPSRPLACVMGASFTYCAVEEGAIPGQLTVSETRELIDTMSEQRWSCSSN
jgi:3-dehydroquinate dehydratase-1